MNRMYYIDNAICIKNITHEWYTAITYHAPESIPVHSCQPLWQMEGLHILDTGHLINADQRCDTNCSKCSRKTIIAYCVMNKKKKSKQISESFSSFRKGTNHLRPQEIIEKTQEKNKSHSWKGATVPWPWAALLVRRLLTTPELLRRAATDYWGTQHQQQFSAWPG